MENVKITVECEGGSERGGKGAFLLVNLRQLDKPIFIFHNRTWAECVGGENGVK